MIIDYVKALRLFGRDVRLYFFTMALIGFTVFGGVAGGLLNLYLLRLGYGPEFIGTINAVNWLSLALFALPAGALGLRLGVRRVMIGGMSLLVVGHGLFPTVEYVPRAWWPGWLLATRVLGGLGLALYLVNSVPFLMGATTPERRDHAFSTRMALIPLAGFAGSLVGGLLPGLLAGGLGVSLEHPAPYRYSLLVAALLLIPGVAALWATRPIHVERTGGRMASRRAAIPYGPIAVLVLVGMLRVAGEGGVRSFINVYLDASLRVTFP